MSESELVNPSQLSTQLEAILYLKAQPLTVQELADYAVCDTEEVEEALLMLMQDYAQRNSALEVVESRSGFTLQLREAYMGLVQTIVPTDLGVGALRTLAAIALKGPIAQTQLVELRGSGAYQHVGDLVEEGFVSRRRQSNGRSYSVQVTEKFYQYFEVDELPKLKLRKTVRQRRKKEVEEASSAEEAVKVVETAGTVETVETNEAIETDEKVSPSEVEPENNAD
ncbi:MAG: SMC-Scp complex subunit ScpB [Cyanobacteria bacterium P01_F01_bin.42]